MSMPSVLIGFVSVQHSELKSANVPIEMRPMMRNSETSTEKTPR